MTYMMFTKHLEGLDIDGLIVALKSVGVQGADLCVRPGYPVTPENISHTLPEAARRFRDAGLTIPLVTLPTSFNRPRRRRDRADLRGVWRSGRTPHQDRLLALDAGKRLLVRGGAHPRADGRLCHALATVWRANRAAHPFRSLHRSQCQFGDALGPRF